MTNPFATPAAQNFGLLMARATLGLYFAAIGYQIVIHGVSNFAREHVKDMPAFVTPQYGEVFLTLYPVVQVTAGVLLALGVLTRISAFLLATTLLVYMACIKGFGAEAGMPFSSSLIFLAVAIAILTNGGGAITLPTLFGKKSAGAKPPSAAPAMK